METKYSLTVKNESKNNGNICVFQTMPEQPDNMLSLAWLSKAPNPETSVKFDWKTQFNFVWSEQGELKPGIVFNASQVLDAQAANTASNFEECNSEPAPSPKFYAVFGNFDDGDIIDITTLENAVELNPEDMGKTLVINEDNSISIEFE